MRNLLLFLVTNYNRVLKIKQLYIKLKYRVIEILKLFDVLIYIYYMYYIPFLYMGIKFFQLYVQIFYKLFYSYYKGHHILGLTPINLFIGVMSYAIVILGLSLNQSSLPCGCPVSEIIALLFIFMFSKTSFLLIL